MGKRSKKLNFIFLMKGFSYLDVCLSFSQVITAKFLLCRSDYFSARWSTALPQLVFCREVTSSDLFPLLFSEFDPSRQPTCCGFSGAVPFYTADVPCFRNILFQMLINTPTYWFLLLMHPLVWTDILLQQPCSFSFLLFKCQLLSAHLSETSHTEHS